MQISTIGKLALAAGLPLNSSIKAAEQSRPNILLILADDLGWSDLGVQGSTFYKTPNIDQLASEGMRFTAAYATPVCSPTRAAIMTGKSPARLHLTNPLSEMGPAPKSPRERGKDYPWHKYIEPLQVRELRLEEVTIAERLRDTGYATAIFGKWHLGGKGFEPEKQGFEVNVGAGHYAHPKTFFSPYQMDDVIKDGPPGEYLTDRLTDEAIRFIQASRAKPFFIYLSHYAVHTPIQAKPEVVARYAKNADSLQPQNNPDYAAMIDSLDENIGKLMAALKASGQEKNTVVIFVSDNGGVIHTFGGNQKVTSNLPLRSGKGTLWEGGVRVPMVVRWPGVTAPGSICSTPVTCEDFYPTFCEMAGLPVQTGDGTEMDGESIIALLKNSSAPLQRDTLCWLYPHGNEFTEPCSAIRKGDMKLIRFYGSPVKLFNLKKDIGESNDLAVQYPEMVAELGAKLDVWLSRVGAWEMVPNPQYNPLMHEHGIYPAFDPIKDGARVVAEWNFDGNDPGDWTAVKKCAVSVRDGKLTVVSQGYGAVMEIAQKLSEPGTYVIQVKVREEGIKEGACVLFWKDDTQKQFDRSQRIQFALPHNTEENVTAALFRISKPADSLRFDPATTSGKLVFDWIRIYKTRVP
jgi:arylsulfatase A